MRRVIVATLAWIVMLSYAFSVPVFAQEALETVKVQIDGLPVTFDVEPIVQNGRTLVPFRAIAKALNVDVVWNCNTQTINAAAGKTAVRLQIGNKVAYRDNASISMDVAPRITKGRTLIQCLGLRTSGDQLKSVQEAFTH